MELRSPRSGRSSGSSSLLVRRRTGSRWSSGRERAVAAARLGGRTDARAAAPLRPLGQLRDRRRPPPRPRPARPDGLGVARRPAKQRLRVYPLPETLRADRQHPSRRSSTPATRSRGRRAKGSSSPTCALFAAGDRVRSINWRASARRNVLVVNERHPERNADVILFLDTFADARAGGRSTLDLAVRATATLASRYLERRDRVGLVSFGGVLRWLTPGMGVDAALPDRRRPARVGDRLQLRVEGRLGHPGTHAAARRRWWSR